MLLSRDQFELQMIHSPIPLFSHSKVFILSI